MPEDVFVGIDVAQERLDVHVLPHGTAFSSKNDAEGISALIERLRQEAPTVIVMEASGGFEIGPAAELGAAGLPLAIVNPRQVRDFARGIGKLAKTDSLDAYVLARFAQTNNPQPKPLASEEEQLIKELVRRRRQLVDFRAAEKNRLHRVRSEPVRESIRSVIRALDEHIGKIDHDLDDLLKNSPLWREKEELLKTFPGVGTTTARELLALLPELGNAGRGQIASLSGLAPMNRDSGKKKGKRMILGGRAEVRKALYMPAVCARRHNKRIKAFYESLLETGKPVKVALTACMRKILVILNSMLKSKSPFQEVFA